MGGSKDTDWYLEFPWVSRVLSSFYPKLFYDSNTNDSIDQEGAKFEWGLKQDKAFSELKNRLTQAPVLTLPRVMRTWCFTRMLLIRGWDAY
jgi:hypothetical protein